MIKLHGIAVSSYYNITKLALLEKDLPFEEVVVVPARTPEVTRFSPMGKIPYLVDGEYALSESQAILLYLERIKPGLYPVGAQEAGRAQQIHQMLDLYVDAVARQLLGAAFFGRTTTAETIAEVGKQLDENLAALAQVVVYNPCIAGDDLTHADLAAFAIFGLARAVMTRVGGADPLAADARIAAYMERLMARPAFARVAREQMEAGAGMMKQGHPD